MKDQDIARTGKGARLSFHAKPGGKQASKAAQDLGITLSRVQLNHILVPTDFSEASEKALTYARRFVDQFGSKVTVLHVIQPMVYPTEMGYPPPAIDLLDETVRERVAERLQSLASQHLAEAQTLVRSGQPYMEIATAAKELDADLIIISTHGHTGLKHVFLGSTAERVVRHAPCPVLTVREREHDFV